MIGVAVERSPDDGRQRLSRRRGDALRLVDELWAGGQQLLDPAQIILPKGEQDLDRERPAQQPHEQLDQTPLRVTAPASSNRVMTSSNWSKISSSRCRSPAARTRSSNASAARTVRGDDSSSSARTEGSSSSSLSSALRIRSTTSSSDARGCTRSRSGAKPSLMASGIRPALTREDLPEPESP